MDLQIEHAIPKHVNITTLRQCKLNMLFSNMVNTTLRIITLMKSEENNMLSSDV